MSRRTTVALVAFLVFGVAFVLAEYACEGCYRMPVPGSHARAPQRR